MFIAASGIILGMHFLSDVLVGAAIGAILGEIGYHTFMLF
jgi:membrane-associated phospholipid phosphatase